jgi:hypothetical protein
METEREGQEFPGAYGENSWQEQEVFLFKSNNLHLAAIIGSYAYQSFLNSVYLLECKQPLVSILGSFEGPITHWFPIEF